MIPVKRYLSELKPSETLAINQNSNRLLDSGKTVFKFGFGQSPFPVPDSVQEALRANAFQKDYLPVQGLPALQEAIATHTNKLITNSNYKADNIIIGPGSKELIFLFQLALDAPLLLPNPSWVSYAPQAYIHKKEVHWVPTQRASWKLSAEGLEEYLIRNNLHTGILILNYPSNPTGAQFTDTELKAIAQICRRHHILVLSDEIYGLLTFDDQYRTIASYYPEGTIITTGLSKWCGAGGWRLGAAIIPDPLSNIVHVLKALVSETFSAVSAPIQYAAVTAYSDSPDLIRYRKNVTKILHLVSDYCGSLLRDNGIHVPSGEGGFYLFPDFGSFQENFERAGIHTSNQMCTRLLDESGIALLPGSTFGRPATEFTARLSFVDFDGQKSLEFYRQHGFIHKDDFDIVFPKISTGMNILSEWIRSYLTIEKSFS